MNKPTIEQVAWVFKKLCEHMKEGGTFRYLIYDRMGFDDDAYLPLYSAGGLALSNAFDELAESKQEFKSTPGGWIDWSAFKGRHPEVFRRMSKCHQYTPDKVEGICTAFYCVHYGMGCKGELIYKDSRRKSQR
jgi:hypothetical protein